MKKMCIYMIKNNINNKVYIGQTIDFENRKKQHQYMTTYEKGKSYNYPLYKAMRKYGLNNFDFLILDDDINDREELNEKEIYYIEKYKARDPKYGYNIHYGGNDQAGEHNGAYGYTGAKSWHAKKVIDVTTGKVYDSLIDCALKLFGDKKYLKCISNVCNPESNKFSYRKHIFRFIDNDGNVIKKSINPKPKSMILIKEMNTGIIIRGIAKTAETFNLTKKIIINRIYGLNKFKSDVDIFYNFVIINTELEESTLTDAQINYIKKVSEQINIKKRIYHGKRNQNKKYKYEEIK